MTVVSRRFQLDVQESDVPVLEELFSCLDGAAVDTAKHDDTGVWTVSAFFPADIEPDSVFKLVDQASNILGHYLDKPEITEIADEDWQQKMYRDFPPLDIGSFFIHTFDEPCPEGKIALKIPAGMAFGTGEHPTTSGCLQIYEQVAQNQTFKNGLDMGCGSGILALAVAKKDGVPFVGVDIDDSSIPVAIENIETNNVDDVSFYHGDGFDSPEVVEKAPYDLIFANILANPLIEMSGALSNALSETGVAILSGFLENQKQDVYNAYQENGLTFVSEVSTNNWIAVAFRK